MNFPIVRPLIVVFDSTLLSSLGVNQERDSGLGPYHPNKAARTRSQARRSLAAQEVCDSPLCFSFSRVDVISMKP